jgi:integrase
MPLKIFKRGEVWHYRGTVSGRRLRGTTGTTTKETAARYISTLEAQEWKRGFDGPQAVLTFAQAAMLYRSSGKPTRFLERIEDYWKDTLVKDVTKGGIRQSAQTLYPHACGATRNRQAIVPTQAIINHASEADLCAYIKVKRFKTETKIKTPATLSWVRSFMVHAAPHLGGLALFMFLTGARISEALAVQWKDVDLQAKTVLIRQSKIGAERRANLPAPLVVALANIEPIKGRPVFLYRRRSDCLRVWRTAAKRAGIEPLSFHSCRHGFATALLRAGIDPLTVAKLGGWKTARHVFETYGHAKDDPTLTDLIADTPLTHDRVGHSRKPLKTGTS